jgi:multidrug efflux pump subunit AcrA (membrane-fusion protein)
MALRGALLKQIATGLVVCVVAVGLILFLVAPAREALFALFAEKDERKASKNPWENAVVVVHAGKDVGVRLSDAAMANLEVNPVEAKLAVELRPLPPQIGTVNYDNDHLFTIRPRFAGEMISFAQVKLEQNPYWRDIRFGDTVKQGQSLGVFWSKDLGMAKADLTDAIINKKLSQDTLKRHMDLSEKGVIPLATLRQSQKQFQADMAAYFRALRLLMMWKLPKDEIRAVEKEADTIGDPTKRNLEEEVKKWAKVEIKAPVFARDADGKPDPRRELIILEKNFNIGDMLDPGRDTPLFRLADLSRLQIWVHPPEEYLPLIREHTGKDGAPPLKWEIRFQADPPGTRPLELTISHVSPSLDPTLHTPMLIGYLDNPERKYLVGQFVTATILAPPPPKLPTVEVPTDAINLVESQSLVFVRKNDGNKNEYYLRRVAVAHSAGKFSLVRSVLTPEDEKLSLAETKKGRRPIETLQPGEVVLTRGVVELTSALEDMLTEPAAKRE